VSSPATRRQFLAGIAAAATLRAEDAGDSLLMLTGTEAERIRNAVPWATGRLNERVRQLRVLAARELHNGPWSVTAHRPEGSKFDPHDYFSEGPYFWPDPKNPTGPYIRRDGRRNPDRFVHNHDDLGAMATCVLTLGAATYFLDDAGMARHALEILYTWFVDPNTRMNPNLEHGQAIRGVNDGRGTGLIDTVSLIHCVQGILLLKKAGQMNDRMSVALAEWFSLFLIWMTTSPKGKAEGKSGNNHATWWTAQVAAYATLLRNTGALDEAWEHYKTYLVPEEIKPNGSCPREEARTNSLSYSTMNADGFATLCRIAQSWKVDLWSFETPQGISYQRLVRYVEPFVLHPEKWKGEQISKFNNDSTVFLGLAGAGLHDRGLLDAYKSLPRADSAWVTFVDLILVA
jgi:hypothetical protein